MYLSGLDELDQKILQLLIENARYSYSEINCRLHVHAVAAGQDEMDGFISGTIDRLPGVVTISTNVILSRVKDIKGLRL